MNNYSDFFNDFLNAYSNTEYAKSKSYMESRLELACRKKEFEKILDEMWQIYIKGNTSQIVEYNKQKNSIKSLGARIYRNSQGKHKIIID